MSEAGRAVLSDPWLITPCPSQGCDERASTLLGQRRTQQGHAKTLSRSARSTLD
jgi:hypothetical protein